jgi:hypothetical protein
MEIAFFLKIFAQLYFPAPFRLYYYRSRLIRRLLNKGDMDPEAVSPL